MRVWIQRQAAPWENKEGGGWGHRGVAQGVGKEKRKVSEGAGEGGEHMLERIKGRVERYVAVRLLGVGKGCGDMLSPST